MSIEAAVLATPLLLVLVLTIAVGRLGMANNSIDQVVHDAARIASIATTGPEASSDAYAAAQASLANQGIVCAQLSVEVDTSGFTAPAGTPAQVDVVVTCTVPLSDLLLPGAPGSITLTATASRAIDTYRERS